MNNSLHKGVELTNYQNENINFNILRENGYDTAILECGGGNTVFSDDTPYSYFDTHYNQAINARFKVGYYFWVYSNVDPKLQAKEFYNLIKGKQIDCKFILDVETGSVKNTQTGIPYGYYNGMSIDDITIGIIEEFKNLVLESGLSNVSNQDFVVYSSRDFLINNLKKSMGKYNLWIADPIGTIPNIDEKIVCDGIDINWVGWQWVQDIPFNGVGTSCDFDVFKDNMFFENSIVLGESKGKIAGGGNIPIKSIVYKNGEYVKLKSGCKEFAPNKILPLDKKRDYKIITILNQNEEELYELDSINQYVMADEIKIIQSKKSNSINSGKTTKNYNTGGGRIPINGYENDYISNKPNGLYPGGNGYSNSVVEFIKNYETLSLTVYTGEDSQNQTIGWGHAVPQGTYPPHHTISLREAEELLKNDLNNAANAVIEAERKYNCSLNQNQFDAMVSFVMNVNGYLFTTISGGPLEPTMEHSVFKYLKNKTLGDIYLRTCFTEFGNANVKGVVTPSEGVYDRRFAEFWIFKYGVYDVIKGTPISIIQNSCAEFY